MRLAISGMHEPLCVGWHLKGICEVLYHPSEIVMLDMVMMLHQELYVHMLDLKGGSFHFSNRIFSLMQHFSRQSSCTPGTNKKEIQMRFEHDKGMRNYYWSIASPSLLSVRPIASISPSQECRVYKRPSPLQEMLRGGPRDHLDDPKQLLCDDRRSG